MADRLIDIIVGLQRMAENAHIRGDDLEYTHREEVNEYLRYLDQLIGMTEKLHNSLLADRKRFIPVERVQHLQDDPKIPRVVKQGPKEVA